jgi:hypothetical protein
MKKETYTLYLNSQTATNRIGTTKSKYQYYINWNTILPTPENINQKYLVRFTFTTLSTGSVGDIYTISIDFGGSNMYDQTNNKTNFLGFAYPIGNNGTNYYLQSKYPDNVPVTVEYPNNSLITVSINPLNTAGGGYAIESFLVLEFTPI